MKVDGSISGPMKWYSILLSVNFVNTHTLKRVAAINAAKDLFENKACNMRGILYKMLTH